ncbi:Vps62-related protein [Streptomyces flavidovirens]|uniref:Vps62-related protein n=1 Tax=Streptomyces flavidovirens TaxID=67298 RepID=UPI00040F792B|nr:Vps62-related protein [Streptomyces flavidovirens]
MVDTAVKYGALQLSFANQFSFAWNDKDTGSKFKNDIAFWRPGRFSSTARPPAVGNLVVKDFHDPHGRFNYLFLDEAAAGGQMLKAPVDYRFLWNDRGTGSKFYGTIWRPIPPPGYVVLSDLFWPGRDKPPLNAVSCVRKTLDGRNYVRPAEIGHEVWNDRGSGSSGDDIALWSIDAPPLFDNDGERLIVPVGGFTYVQHYNTPSPNEVCWVLDLPAVVETNPGPSTPQLTSYARPPATEQITDRVLTVPHTMVKDPDRDAAWQYTNSPFYKVRRKRRFTLIVHGHNTTSQTQTPEEEVTTGVTKEKSEAFSVKTGISVTTSGGVSLGFAEARTEISISLEMGYESRTSLSIFESKTLRRGIAIAPNSAGALWCDHHELNLVRADGSVVGTGQDMDMNIPSYYWAAFPQGSGGGPTGELDLAEAQHQVWQAPAPDTDFELLAKAGPPPGAVDPLPEEKAST